MANALLDAPVDDVFGEGVEEVGAALQPRVVETCRPLATIVIARGDFFQEVVPILFQAITRVEIGIRSAVGNSPKAYQHDSPLVEYGEYVT